MSDPRGRTALTLRIARVLRQALERGGSIDIDGLGTLSPGGKHGFRFVAQNKPRVLHLPTSKRIFCSRRSSTVPLKKTAFVPGWIRRG